MTDQPKTVPPDLLLAARREVARNILANCFGDGQEADFAWYGVTLKGAQQMTVAEVLDAVAEFHDTTDTDEFSVQIRPYLDLGTGS